MARRRHSRRRGRGSFGFLYKLLSVLAICGAIIAAMTLFFRVDEIVVTGQKRYTAEEIQTASGVEPGAMVCRAAKKSALVTPQPLHFRNHTIGIAV